MKIALLYVLLLSAVLPHYTWAWHQATPTTTCTTVRNAYVAVHRQATPQTEQKFLRAFPATYSAFTAVFGYRGRATRTKFGCLYDTSMPYIEQLFTLHQVPRSEVFTKLLGIGRHAYWQSDGLTILQYYCIDLTTTDASFLAFLNRQSEADIRSFTRFLLLNPVSNEPLRKQLRRAYAKYSHLQKVMP